MADPLGRAGDDFLSPTTFTSWLLVLDNADDPEIINGYWPVTGVGAVLATSRNPIAKEGVYLPTGMDVLPLPDTEASELLLKLSGRENEPNSLKLCAQIVQKIGGLPFAIVQMDAIIRRRHLFLKELLEYYEEDAKRLQETVVPGLTYGQTVASVWAVEELPAPAIALLRVLSLLDADGILEIVLLKGAKEVELEDFPKKKSEYFDARGELLKSSLITRHPDTGEIRAHRLVQDVVRQRMTVAELLSVFNAVVILLSAVWPFAQLDNRNLVERRKICQTHFPHI